MNRVGFAIAIVVVGLSSSAIAHADSVARTHDGFYLRVGFGLGYVHDGATIEDANESQVTLSGGGPVGEFLLGGTPAPGLVVGGGFQGATVFDPRVSGALAQGSTSGTLNLTSVGPFVDYSFDPRRGLHFQAFAGFARVQYRFATGAPDRAATGGVLSVGFGDDWFVSDQWSIGVLGRVQLAHTSDSVDDVTGNHNVVIPAVLASFTYH